jgi:hypothetical protein
MRAPTRLSPRRLDLELSYVGNDFGAAVTYDYPAQKKFSGEVNWVEIDLGKDSVNLDHLISPEERLHFAMGTQ